MEATRAAGRESSLHGTLEEVRREADLLRQDLRDRDGRNAAAQATIASLHNAIREMRDTSLVRGQEGESRSSDEWVDEQLGGECDRLVLMGGKASVLV